MKYKMKANLVWEKVGDEIVVLDPEQGKYFSLNRSAGEILKFFEKTLTKEEFIKRLGAKYKDNEKMVVKDAKKCFSSLLDLGILKRIT